MGAPSAIEAAIRSLEPHSSLRRLIGRIMDRTDFFPRQPYEGDEEFVPLRSAPDLIGVGRSYRNCLRRIVGRAFSGHVA
jgi:hypothetical protein